MNRLPTLALLGAATLTLAACGSGASAGNSNAKASGPSGPSGVRIRNAAAGELVQLNGMTLVLSASTGDTTVTYDSSTTFQRTSTGVLADITVGKCVAATGQKDASGQVVAANVTLSDQQNGTCTFGSRQGGPGGPGGASGPNASPAPERSPRPNFSPNPNFAIVVGQVTAVNGTAVTINNLQTGNSQTVTIPTTARVNKVLAAAATDLALHQCIAAAGPRDSSGKVTARSITIVPAGPSGCFTGGGGIFRFGGGGRGGGGGGGGFGGGGFGGPPGD